MASLKEIRSRILSVTSTRKITSAMKMVSAAKLKKAQTAVENTLPYVEKLDSILRRFMASLASDAPIAVSEVREVHRVVLVGVSSNSSLCGAFNSNAIKQFMEVYRRYVADLGRDAVVCIPVGEKMRDALAKANIPYESADLVLSDHVDYATVGALADRLMRRFEAHETDRVEVVYNHFKNAGVQIVRHETLLPFVSNAGQEGATGNTDYIVEPDPVTVVMELVPKFIRLQLFTMLQDSLAAEHGARTTAMQIATDNADALSQELTLSYNKLRQASITNEIITITGGAEALK